MRTILLIFLFIFSFRINSQTYVLIPDANFANYLQAQMPSAMNGYSLNITSTQVTTTQSLTLVFQNIANLFGVQYFTSLVNLDCSNNSLTSLPTLPTSLSVLYCHNNSLSSLPTLPSSLTQLECGYNSLSSLPALPNSLTSLKCHYNYITNLPTLPNSLAVLHCYKNSMPSLPVLPNTLTFLDCSDNSITALPTLPASMTHLYCYKNSLTASLPNLPSSLQILDCSVNSLSSIPALPNSLTSLTCYSNAITSIPPLPSSMNGQFWCSYNLLTSLPSIPNSLNYLDCSNNQIKCFPVFPTFLSTIILTGNPFLCLPNYVLPAMNMYTTTPICVQGNADGCSVTGINEFNLANYEISVYPNPSNKFITIETNKSETQTISLFDVIGRSVLTQACSNKTTIDVTNLNEGIYNLIIKTDNNILNKKLVISR